MRSVERPEESEMTAMSIDPPSANAAEYLLDRQVAAGRGERIAVRSMGQTLGRTLSQTLSYQELLDLSAAFAAGLAAVDVRAEERVLLVTSDGVEMLAALLGAIRAGAVAVPCSTMLLGSELGKVLADSGARLVVVTPEFGSALSQALTVAPSVRHVVAVGNASVEVPAGVQHHDWSTFAVPGTTAGSAAPVHPDAPALWLYTSGTTGTPKAAMHRHANIRLVCETYGERVLGIRPDDVCLSVAKLFFAYGLGNSALFPLSAGASAILEPRRPTPQVVAERLRQDQPTLFFGGPTFFAALLASEIPDDSFRSVRLCASAGESLPAPLYRRFVERFGVDILDGIGSTEMLHIFLSNRPGQVRPGTTGQVVPGYQLDLRDESGRPVPVGTPGTLFVRGGSAATGYWCRTAATRAVFQGEWVCTGDTYQASEDGFYTCLGRTNDLLKAGGIWVSPAEVESRLLEHPSVAEAVVVGVSDADGLDKPVACVVPAAGHRIDPAELVEWCRDGLAAFKRPRAVLIIAEVPKTATGKVQRFRVREFAQAAAGPALTGANTPPGAGAAPAADRTNSPRA
ncbi:MAG TPA: benzoate-CoA ligase family protein [Mycobacteriales bacterium]|nr:benzoate-CoA ligase family protein [Mycobacteriales bacterium]